jgi:hypothetical protein
MVLNEQEQAPLKLNIFMEVYCEHKVYGCKMVAGSIIYPYLNRAC